jgi:hypothetical protein
MEKICLFCAFACTVIILLHFFFYIPIVKKEAREEGRIDAEADHAVTEKAEWWQLEGMMMLLQWYYEIMNTPGEQAAIGIAFYAYLKRANQLQFVISQGEFVIDETRAVVMFVYKGNEFKPHYKRVS